MSSGVLVFEDEVLLGLLPDDNGTDTLTVSTGQGPKGDPGPEGPPGTGVGYVHTQASAAATWTVTHNLGHYPLVNVVVGGEVVIADITHVSTSVLAIAFAAPASGLASVI